MKNTHSTTYQKKIFKVLLSILFIIGLSLPKANAQCSVNSMPTLTKTGNCVTASYYPTSSFGTVQTVWARVGNNGLQLLGSWSTGTSLTYCAVIDGSYQLCARVWGCTSTTETLTQYIYVCNNLTYPGSIGSPQTFCGTGSKSLTSLAGASGGSGGYVQYQWQKSTNNSSWSNISGATGPTYYTSTFYSTTYYRRGAKRSNCSNYIYTSSVKLTVDQQLTNPGSIGSPQTFCGSGSASLNNFSYASGGSGSAIQYQWQYSTNNSFWNNISGATGPTYYSPTITSTTYFRRRATRGSCINYQYTSSVKITINGALTSPGSIGSPQTFCGSGSPVLSNFSSASGGSGGTVQYQWQRSTNNSSWSNISGATGSTYYSPTVTSTTYFRRSAKRSLCGNSYLYTGSVKVTIQSGVDAGNDGSTTVCDHSTSSINLAGLITGEDAGGVWTRTAGTGGTFSASNGTFIPAVGATSSTFRYTVNGASPCPNDFSLATVTINGCQIMVSGTVFNDIDGLTDNDVDGIAIGAPSSITIYASLINAGNVVATTPINANGTYSFPNVTTNSTYSMVLSTVAGSVGNAAPVADLPAGWMNTGESPNNATSDGTVDGMQTFTVGTVNVPNIDFGIQQPPTPGIDSIPPTPNPRGNVCVVVPGSKFSGVDASAGGIITNLTICTFPSNIDKIEINSVVYTSANWPVSGVTIPTNAQGEPTQGICIDPINGLVTNEINYTVTDNAGATSACDGKVIIKFYPIKLSGIVFHDESGPTNVDGSPVGTAGGNQLYANLIDAAGNVEAVTAIDNQGMYEFLDISINTAYSVVLTDVAGTISNPAPAAHLPEGWVNVSEDCCDGIGNDGNTDGINLSPTVTSDVPNVNFGIREPVAIGNYVWVDSNKNGVIDGSEGPLSGAVVNLYEDNDNDGSPDGAAVATMTTVANGLYKFEDLYSGKYIVGVTPPAITGGIYVSSVVGEETNPNLDVDGNDNGITQVVDEVRSGTVNLVSNTEPLGETPNNTTTPDSNANLTIDFGFYACPTNFMFDSVDLCLNTTFDLTAVEPALFTGGAWTLNSVLVPTPTAVGVGTYTYTYNEGNCSATGDVTLTANVPDYTPTIQIAPSAITGTSSVRVILTLSELLNKNACSDLYILVPKLLPRFQFTFNNNATIIGGIAVDNADWQYYENANPNFYVWQYTANNNLFPSGGSSKIGYIGTYDPNHTDGQSTFSVQIFQGSGGETNQTNNTDSELLIYFR